MSILDHAWGVSAAADRVWAQVSGLAPSRSFGRVFVVLQAFIDESFDDQLFVMGGYISTVQSWADFSNEWEQMLPWGVLDKADSYHFKMTEMAKSEERMSRFPAFYRIIERHLNLAVSVSINKIDIKHAKSRIVVPHPDFRIEDVNMVGLDNIYNLACTNIMQLIEHSREVIQDVIPIGEKIDFYFDDRMEKKFIMEAFEGFQKTLSDQDKGKYGATPRFENDKEFLPLQAADCWAWWVREACQRSLKNNGGPAAVDFDQRFQQREDGPRKLHFYMNEDHIAKIYEIRTRLQVNPEIPIYNVKMGHLVRSS